MSSPQPVANPYQRRLGLLAAGMAAAIALLALRHAWLSLVQGEHHRREAMNALVDVRVLPAMRGSILDRRGESLARDAAPGYAVELRAAFVDDDAWVVDEAARRVRASVGRGAWRRMGEAARGAAIHRARPEAEARRDALLAALARAGGRSRTDLDRRLREIDAGVERLAAHVHRRQELAWAARALGTDVAGLLARARPSAAAPAGRGTGAAAAAPSGDPDVLRFGRGALAAFDLSPDDLPPSGPRGWSLAALLQARGIDPGGFVARPIREQVGFHEVLEPIPAATARDVRRIAEDLGLEDVLRLDPATVRERPWSRATVEVDGSMLPGPLAFDAPRAVLVEGLASDLVGRIGPVYAEDHAARPFDAAEDRGGYRPLGDRIGRGGLEGLAEDVLRGERGLERTAIELSRERIGGEAPRSRTVPADHGADVRSTVDVRLQARIRAVLHPDVGLTLASPEVHGASGLAGVPGGAGHPLAVGVAVLDVESGEVLALVNGPDRRELPDPEMEPIIDEAGWLELDVAGLYGTTPGSTIKPMILAAAIAEGLRGRGDEVECTGHYFADPGSHRCWIHRPPAFATHGALDGPQALSQSCNIFFHRAADEFDDPARLQWWLRAFGLGAAPGDVPTLGGGRLPDVARLRISRGEEVLVGTGQGAMTWTPVQAATAYAALFRGGSRPSVRLVREPAEAFGVRAGAARGAGAVDAGEAAEAVDATDPGDAMDAAALDADPRPPLELDAAAVEAARAGLELGVHAYSGTAHHVRVGPTAYRIFTPELVPDGPVRGRAYREAIVYGKTGTAQEQGRVRVPAADDDAMPGDVTADTPAGAPDEREPAWEVRGLAHAWFVGVVEPADGSSGGYAIAVVVRWGGSGGRVAGPIANQVVLALMQEGYLPMEPGLGPTKVRPGGTPVLVAGEAAPDADVAGASERRP